MNFKKKRLFCFLFSGKTLEDISEVKGLWIQHLTQFFMVFATLEAPCHAELICNYWCCEPIPWSHFWIELIGTEEFADLIPTKAAKYLGRTKCSVFHCLDVSVCQYLGLSQYIAVNQRHSNKHAARRWTLIIEPYLIISLKFKYASSTTGWTVRPLLCST